MAKLKSLQLPENFNLATKLDDDKLRDIANECLENYKNDRDSRRGWEEMHEKWKKLYYMQDRPINPPWENSSTESIPMLAEACGQFHARAYGALFPGRKILTCTPTGVDVSQDILERVKRVSAHMSYQLMDRDKNYKRNKDRLLLSLPLHGSMFTKTYYDQYQQRIRVDNVRAADLVVPYGTGPRDIADLPRTTERIWLPIHRTNFLYKTQFFSAQPKPYSFEDDDLPVDQAHDDATGMQKAQIDDYALLLEQHTYLDLDDDGVEEPYIVTIDYASSRVVRLTIRYEVDAEGKPTDYKNAINYYTHYAFIDNPDGFYGLGYGLLLGPINTSINKILRQMIDSGTLSNVGNLSGIADARLGLKGGDFNIQLGKFTKANTGMDDISKGIWQPKFPGPAPVLNDVMRSLTLRGDRLAMVTESITGQAERVMQPTTVMALIEQSQTVFSAVYERVIHSWSDELDKVYRLNSIYTTEYDTFIGESYEGNPQVMQLAKGDYAPDMRVIPLADPKQSTMRERLAVSDAMMEAAAKCPFIMNDPTKLYEVFRRRFEDIGVHDINGIMPTLQEAVQAVEQQKQQQAMQSQMQAEMQQKAMTMQLVAQYGSGILEHVIDGIRQYIVTNMQTKNLLDTTQLTNAVDMTKIAANTHKAHMQAETSLEKERIGGNKTSAAN